MSERREINFPWTVEEYDRRSESAQPFELLMMIREAQNLVAHREHGELLKSRTELELDELERHIAGRELRRRAEAGDRKALDALVEEAAQLELLIEKTVAECDAREARMRASYARGSIRNIQAPSAPVDLTGETQCRQN